MPPAKLGLVYSHTGLRRFIDAIGAAAHARAVPARRATSTRPPRSPGGSSTASPRRRSWSTLALELAAELAGNAPLSQRGNKRVIAALLAAEGELAEDVEQELIELRRASFASQDMREGMRAFAEKRPPRWRGAVAVRHASASVRPPWMPVHR